MFIWCILKMMKKTLLLIVILSLGWLGFAYFSAAWTRLQFTQEVDSLLGSPRDVSEANLPPLILSKARPFGMEILPEDIQVEISPADTETTTSRLLESKGFTAETRILTLHIRYRQSILGRPRYYTLDRERTFTSRIAPSTQPPVQLNESLNP